MLNSSQSHCTSLLLSIMDEISSCSAFFQTFGIFHLYLFRGWAGHMVISPFGFNLYIPEDE